MNETVDIFSIRPICHICQTSHGFSSADQRSIIVLVVLTGIALILCYVGVLWYAIRHRFIPDDKLSIISESVYKNQAFDNKEDQDEDIESNIPTMIDTTSTQPAVITVTEKQERF